MGLKRKYSKSQIEEVMKEHPNEINPTKYYAKIIGCSVPTIRKYKKGIPNILTLSGKQGGIGFIKDAEKCIKEIFKSYKWLLHLMNFITNTLLQERNLIEIAFKEEAKKLSEKERLEWIDNNKFESEALIEVQKEYRDIILIKGNKND